MTLVQPAEGPEPQIKALEHPSRKSPLTSLDPSQRVTGETDTSWSPWTSPSGQKFRTSPSKMHQEWQAPW